MKRKKSIALSGAGVLTLAGVVLIWATGCRHTEPFRDADGDIIPGSVATMETAEIGGVEQSLWFRGVDTDNPAVVLLHGGPGASEGMLFRHYDADLERHFLVVYWEQRGAGRSYHSGVTRESMTIDRLQADLDEVVELVRSRFGHDRVILLGHSWGTALGTLYAHEHPEKVAAYVGVAQIGDFAGGQRASYAWALERAWKRGDREALEALRAMAPAPSNVDEELAKGRWVEKFGGTFHADMNTGDLIRAALGTDEANLMDLVKFGQGNRFSLETLRPEYSKLNLKTRTQFDVPVVFMLGRYDWHVPTVDAVDYFNRIDAPAKRLIWFEGSAHNVPFEEPDAFVRAMVEDVRPLAIDEVSTRSHEASK